MSPSGAAAPSEALNGDRIQDEHVLGRARHRARTRMGTAADDDASAFELDAGLDQRRLLDQADNLGALAILLLDPLHHVLLPLDPERGRTDVVAAGRVFLADVGGTDDASLD